jgi:hypothetical protein
MNKHIEAQQRHDAGGVDLAGRMIADCRDIDDTIKQTGTAEQHVERFKSDRPPPHWIVLRPLWLGTKGLEKEHVMESDYVLQHTPGVPLSTWRLALPVITDSIDLVTECSTDLQVPVRRLPWVFGHCSSYGGIISSSI